MKLVVLHPFGDYQKGDTITDADKVEAVLKSEQTAYAVKVAVPVETDAPKPRTGK